MSKTTIKICGLKRQEDVDFCINAGVDILGFVTEYPLQVPWNLSRTEAKLLLKMVYPPAQSCIVTGGSPEKIINLAEELHPSLVQLHYKETLTDTIQICEALKKLNIGVIKTVPVSFEERVLQFGTSEIELIIKKLCSTDIFALLVDSRSPGNVCEKGNKLDFDLCSQIISLSSKPVIIAGGITPENVSEILKKTGSQFIDIMTGVECSPREKNAKLLSRLINNVISS